MAKENLLFEEEILIPKERVAVLVGPKGSNKKEIEENGHIRLHIESKENIVKITATDAFELYIARQVVEAIGRGFNPKIAQKLFKEENSYELINFQDLGKKSKKEIQRLKGRVIGTQGKTKEIIQRFTNTDVSIYGKTIGIIGKTEDVQKARHAVEMLLKGAQHKTAYSFLAGEKKWQRQKL